MTKSNQQVALVFYHPQYEDDLKAFYLPEEQQKFTASPAALIKRAEEDANCTPIVIVANGKPAGIFALLTGEEVKEYTNKENALALIAFSINHSEQGNGYAVRGLQLLHNFILENFSGKNEVFLGVNEKNIPAQNTYFKAGFEDRGQRRMGPIGRQLVLCLSIRKE